MSIPSTALTDGTEIPQLSELDDDSRTGPDPADFG
jgi:hypothetical protein